MSDALQKRFDELRVAEHMPSPTGPALAILRLTDSEKTQVSQIVATLEADPALAGRILKLSNSAAFGSSRAIASVKQAVCRLGIRTVRNVALAFSLLSQSTGKSCAFFDYKKFWSRSMATAVAAHALASGRKDLPPDEAFTSGLLCKVGCLALATIYPEQYAAILAKTKGAAPAEVAQCEREQFALDHNELLEALLKDWGLPEVHYRAGRWHECPDDGNLEEGSRVQALARVLNVATLMADLFVADGLRQRLLLADLLARGQALGIEQADMLTLGDRVVKEWHQWGRFLDVPTQEVPPFSELAQSALMPELPAVPDEEAEMTPEAVDPGPDVLRILVIAEGSPAHSPLQAALSAAGHQVQVIGSKSDVMRSLVETSPQMLILDRLKPHDQMLAFCQRLRKTALGQRLYIMMAVHAGEEIGLEEQIDGEVDDFVIHPPQPRALRARIRRGQRFIEFQEQINRDKAALHRYAAELSVVNRRLQQAALEDELTGLPNRRCALDRLNEEWAATSRNGLPMACMIADIDHFKLINDSFGHDIGDAVLRAAASAMRRAVRASDTVCRFGGEEFLILCRETDLASARACAEAVRAAVERGCKDVRGFTGTATVSLGVAARSSQHAQQHQLLKSADQALYAAKQAGRNRVCVAGPESVRG